MIFHSLFVVVSDASFFLLFTHSLPPPLLLCTAFPPPHWQFYKFRQLCQLNPRHRITFIAYKSCQFAKREKKILYALAQFDEWNDACRSYEWHLLLKSTEQSRRREKERKQSNKHLKKSKHSSPARIRFCALPFLRILIVDVFTFQGERDEKRSSTYAVDFTRLNLCDLSAPKSRAKCKIFHSSLNSLSRLVLFATFFLLLSNFVSLLVFSILFLEKVQVISLLKFRFYFCFDSTNFVDENPPNTGTAASWLSVR